MIEFRGQMLRLLARFCSVLGATEPVMISLYYKAFLQRQWEHAGHPLVVHKLKRRCLIDPSSLGAYC